LAFGLNDLLIVFIGLNDHYGSPFSPPGGGLAAKIRAHPLHPILAKANDGHQVPMPQED
jgi:hypothetical protein